MTLRDRLWRAAIEADNHNVARPLVVTPDEYACILADEITTIGISRRDKTPDLTIKSMYGFPIVMVPFADDPLYKELQAMATIIGAEISYPDITYGQQQWKVDIAEFFKDGSGWRYVNGNGTRDGKSRLFPISAYWPSLPAVMENSNVRLLSND